MFSPSVRGIGVLDIIQMYKINLLTERQNHSFYSIFFISFDSEGCVCMWGGGGVRLADIDLLTEHFKIAHFLKCISPCRQP